MWSLVLLVGACGAVLRAAVRRRSSVLFSVACLALSATVTSYSVSVAWQRHPFRQPPMRDAVHAAFPALAGWAKYDLPNAMVLLEAGPVLALLGLHARAQRVLCRAALVYALTMACRAALVLSTTLPDSSPLCHGDPAAFRDPPTWAAVERRALWILVTAGTSLTCGDMMFSGHSVTFVLLALVCTRYLLPAARGPDHARAAALRAAAVAWNAAGLFIIVATRMHYTIDVLVAAYVTCSLWHQVHALLLPRLPAWLA